MYAKMPEGFARVLARHVPLILGKLAPVSYSFDDMFITEWDTRRGEPFDETPWSYTLPVTGADAAFGDTLSEFMLVMAAGRQGHTGLTVRVKTTAGWVMMMGHPIPRWRRMAHTEAQKLERILQR